MKVSWREFSPDEIIVVIECDCGNKQMTAYAAGDFVHKDIYVYRYGNPKQYLRCAPEVNRGCVMIKGKVQCHELYEVTLHRDSDLEPFIEIVHTSVTPPEIICVPFLKKVILKPTAMYENTPWPDPNPYKH